MLRLKIYYLALRLKYFHIKMSCKSYLVNLLLGERRLVLVSDEEMIFEVERDGIWKMVPILAKTQRRFGLFESYPQRGMKILSSPIPIPSEIIFSSNPEIAVDNMLEVIEKFKELEILANKLTGLTTKAKNNLNKVSR